MADGSVESQVGQLIGEMRGLREQVAGLRHDLERFEDESRSSRRGIHEELDRVRLAQAETKRAVDVMEKTLSDPDLRLDFVFMRSWREFYRAAWKHGLFVVIGMLVTGAAAALWIGLQSWIHPSAR
jgi:hypothetical protein